MLGWLRKVGTLIRNSLSREAKIPPGRNSGLECLPPVVGPSEWSHGLLVMMADGGAGWYFDRR
jgi:hypothetical protein